MSTMSSLSRIFTGDRYVTVHALEAGVLTLPAKQFLHPCEPDLRLTKPSLSFLIQHKDDIGRLTRIVFDLGIRRTPGEYSAELQEHLLTRQPLETTPDVRESIGRGCLNTEDIDVVILSHVHWDHVGRPKDFERSLFVVGHGTLNLLQDGTVPRGNAASHSHFEPDLLPVDRTIELSPPAVPIVGETARASATSGRARFADARWQPLLHFTAAIDIFGDQSLFIVDSPGHLQGHLNLLARTGQAKWIYLAGDACHDRRLLSGELDIAEWRNEHGALCCIHSNKEQAGETIRAIRMLEMCYRDEVEVILAHDETWFAVPDNKTRFWPGNL